MKRKDVLSVISIFFSVFLSTYFSAIFVEFSYVQNYWTKMLPVLVFDFLIASVLYFALHLNRIVIKAAGFNELIRLFIIDCAVLFFNVLFRLILGDPEMIRWRFCGLNFIFLGIFLCIFMYFFRFFVQFRQYMLLHSKEAEDRAIIIGAGETGAMLLREMLTSPGIQTRPCCILDDDKSKKGMMLCGVKIEGTVQSVAKYAVKYHANKIIIAVPSATKKQMRTIVDHCSKTGLKVLTAPGISQIVNNQVSFSNLREVNITDLLGRDQIRVDMQEIRTCIENKTVLVTGGGGSIGSELCRQIAQRKPKQLIIFDIYENNAYDIQQELLRTYPELNLEVLIGSIRDKGRIESVFEKYRPQVVFNAAAHKHVPLMEDSPNEAIKNNVFGTFNAARCAEKYGAEKFVQISTDKAVNPTNIMGASKRICEMIIQTIGRHAKSTDFVAVRFGNVLGSNGSVIPLFKKQIAEGGPVTVTHKDIIRYFMTIPEAVSLVLQACCYAKGGEIFVFDMGEPVRIYDLAYHLIELSGLVPNEDIDIVCTGLRPGEKLYEERLMAEEGMEKTANDMISIGKPIELDEEMLWKTLSELHDLAYDETDRIREAVAKLVPTYRIDSNGEEEGKGHEFQKI